MYHFIGIGGIGMSALARLALQQGHLVRGSDMRTSTLLDQLEKEGAQIYVGQKAGVLQAGDTVIYSTDIDAENIELSEAKKLNLQILHRSELLRELMHDQKALLVAGTHGKTTTTALLATVLLEEELDPSFMIGGLFLHTKMNGRIGKGPYFVAEVDESDGSFLKTFPFGAIVTNLDREHLNYWKTEEKLAEGFKIFSQQTKNSAHFFWCKDSPWLQKIYGMTGISYGFSSDATCRVSGFSPTEQGCLFNIAYFDQEYIDIELALYGRHNALNATAVFGLALSLGCSEKLIRRAFKNFPGISRRFECIGVAHNIEIYDDYAHHPAEIAATLKTLRDRVRERRVIALFQPHRYSRVRDLFEEFTQCFEDVDELIITDIYSAGEEAIENITASLLLEKLQRTFKGQARFLTKVELVQKTFSLMRPGDTLITLGAGDITAIGKIIFQKVIDAPPKLSVGLLFGGSSPEHEVSLSSASQIAALLDPTIYTVESFGISKEGVWMADSLDNSSRENVPILRASILERLLACDVCIPVFHGPRGEDGMVQGMLETLSLPYVGCDFSSCAVCMNKSWTKQIAQAHGVATATSIEVDRIKWRKVSEIIVEEAENLLCYPIWIKPVHLGSSIGVSRAINRQELHTAITLAFKYDEILLLEKEVNGRQIEFALLGNEFLRVGCSGEILNQGQFYDYEKKYGSDSIATQTPANLTLSQEQEGKQLAERIYKACNCHGLARIDFFLDQEGQYWLNEINPFPGFTATSLYQRMWAAAGVSPEALCNELIVLALHRYRKKTALIYSK